jgi:ABC-type Na+ efflux pump permease subunit
MKALVLLKKDIRTVLRNRRELVWMIILPVILLVVNFYLQGQALEINVGLVGDSDLIAAVEQQINLDSGQIKLNAFRLSQGQAEQKLQQGTLHAYLLVTSDSADMYANLSDTSGAVAQAFFAEVVRELNHQLALQSLSGLVNDPTALLSPIEWQTHASGKQVSSAGQLIFSSLFVIMGVMTALSLGQQSISMERDKNTLVSLRKSPLTDYQIIWAKLGAGLFSALLPLCFIIALIWFLMPAGFLTDPVFYLIMLVITLNSVALGLLVGSYVRGANEGNGWRFVLTLPAMFLAAMPVTLPVWVARLTSAIPTLVGAQVVRGYLIEGRAPGLFSLVYLLVTALISIQLAGTLLGREE